MSIFRFPMLVWLGIAILITSLCIRQSFSIFMMPISEHYDTGREFFSFAIALHGGVLRCLPLSLRCYICRLMIAL